MIKNRIFQALPDQPSDNCGGVVVLDPDTHETTELKPRLDLRHHSMVDGFAWGYSGTGAAQLALAILVEAAGETDAMRYYHDFKFDVVANQAGNWTLYEQFVLGWLCRRKNTRQGVTIRDLAMENYRST
jgi:hypothetical protein